MQRSFHHFRNSFHKSFAFDRIRISVFFVMSHLRTPQPNGVRYTRKPEWIQIRFMMLPFECWIKNKNTKKNHKFDSNLVDLHVFTRRLQTNRRKIKSISVAAQGRMRYKKANYAKRGSSIRFSIWCVFLHDCDVVKLRILINETKNRVNIERR